MWQMLCNLSVFAAIPNMLRRIERRVKHTNGPEPQEWTMRQDRIASFALPNALEHDMWAHKRKALDEDYWADMRRSSIDAEREERYVWSDAARRKRIAEQTHDVLRPGPNYGFLRPRD